MKKESEDFVRGARWAIRRFRSKLPFNASTSVHGCDCSADAVYYLVDMETILNRNKLKLEKSEYK